MSLEDKFWSLEVRYGRFAWYVGLLQDAFDQMGFGYPDPKYYKGE